MKICDAKNEIAETFGTILGLFIAILDISLYEEDKYSSNSILKIFLMPAVGYSVPKVIKILAKSYDEYFVNNADQENEYIPLVGNEYIPLTNDAV